MSHRHLTNIICDWSGTLVDDLPPVLHATNAVLAHYGSATLDRAAFRREFELPFAHYYAQKLPHATLPEIEIIFRAAFAAWPHPVAALPHAHTFLEYCAATQRRLFILSSALPAAVSAQAEHLQWTPYFDHIYAGVHDKRHTITQLLAEHALHPAHTCIIGDMQHDIAAARAGGLTAIATLTGYDPPERLAASSPDITVPHLSALIPYLS